jgi:hypothetical protein
VVITLLVVTTVTRRLERSFAKCSHIRIDFVYKNHNNSQRETEKAGRGWARYRSRSHFFAALEWGFCDLLQRYCNRPERRLLKSNQQPRIVRKRLGDVPILVEHLDFAPAVTGALLRIAEAFACADTEQLLQRSS